MGSGSISAVGSLNGRVGWAAVWAGLQVGKPSLADSEGGSIFSLSLYLFTNSKITDTQGSPISKSMNRSTS